MSTPRIALLIGSSRQNGNCAGIAAWVSALLNARLNGPNAPNAVEIVTVDPTQPPYPLGPVVDGTHIPAQVRDVSKYASPAVQEWSKFAASCAAFVIVTPQYNWGYPGELKNALDHLYHEWSGKPVAIVTYGGHGGRSMRGTAADRLGRRAEDAGVGGASGDQSSGELCTQHRARYSWRHTGVPAALCRRD